MDTEVKMKFRERLEALQDRLRADAEDVAEQARGSSAGAAAGEQSGVPWHLADRGSEEYLQELNSMFAENEGQLSQEVRDALLRLDENSFGRCENCGQEIPVERLEALPFTRYCYSCAEELQPTAANLNSGRPLGPDDTLSPEGEMGERRRRAGQKGDIYAAGDAGGGTEVGGLAGSNSAGGDPEVAKLQDATGSGARDIREDLRPDPPHKLRPVDYESEADRQRYAQDRESQQ